ncbi:MAG: S8 family serine peptidase [Bacteroidetes bacterium]|nr:S8 family serine peptidase [Bacteroidota bacterium]
MKKLAFVIIGAFMALSLSAQYKYYVYLKDKNGVEFNPTEYFHPKALERRTRCGVAINQTDFPVSEAYKNTVLTKADSCTATSRWLNMITIWGNENLATELLELEFVKSVNKAPMNAVITMATQKADDISQEAADRYATFQLERMNGFAFHDAGYTGKGIRIAVLDAGFSGFDGHDGLEHLNIEANYDFVRKESFVYDYSSHGTGVTGCIGGRMGDDVFTGLAYEATYLLARTEKSKTEKFSEEEFWLEAAEWADKNGADLINSSLGYTKPRYFIEQMDGKTTLVSKAAQMAFAKGIVVVTSAGNEGDGDWKYIGSPADADSVLAIGGIDAYKDYKIDFSSYGPNSRGLLKPNVSALGTAVSARSDGGFGKMSGTSFSSPLVAGFVACYMQANPDKTQQDVFEAIQQCGHLYPYYDYVHGYGIPVAWKALGNENAWPEGNAELVTNDGDLVLEVDFKYFAETLNNDSTELAKKNIYLHAVNEEGKLLYYSVLHISNPAEVLIELDDDRLEGAAIIRVHFEGKTLEYNLR